LPAPAAGARASRLLGATRNFCCAGCEAVAHAIVGGGLERYYETRARPAPPPRGFPEVEIPDGHEAALLLEGVTCAACLWLIEPAIKMIRRSMAAGIKKLVGVEIVSHFINRVERIRLRLKEPVRITKRFGFEIHRKQTERDLCAVNFLNGAEPSAHQLPGGERRAVVIRQRIEHDPIAFAETNTARRHLCARSGETENSTRCVCLE